MQQKHATLTINTLLQPSTNIHDCANAIIANIERLRAVVEHIPAHLPPEMTRTTSQLVVQDLLPANAWKELVAATVQKIQQGIHQKVVLARGVQARSETEPLDVNATLYRLRAHYPDVYIFAIQRGASYFVGATPERLLRVSNGQVLTMALAGSAPRDAIEEKDQQLCLELLQSKKNKSEHTIVVATICDALAHICSQIWVADTPELLRLQNIQHLKTPIIGKLLPDHYALEALQELHPTPAVGGFPRDAALGEIRDHEGLDRGWYAGPIGWIDANGNGEFAVALRSALINGNKATLFAGCGIVADSNPESEYAESCWKLKVMLRGLGRED
jgi:isochorismate synthase